MAFSSSRLGFWYKRRPKTFDNGNFVADITGWDIFDSQIKLNGVSTVAGYPTPSDPTTTEFGAIGDNTSPNAGYEFLHELSAEVPPGSAADAKSLRLYSSGVAASHAIIHGPYMVSQKPVSIDANGSVSFWWRAANGGDAFDVFAYLLNVDTGSTLTLLNQTGASGSEVTPWTHTTKTVPSAGRYKFVFVSGSHDFSGGTVLGASLYLTNISVQ